MTESRYDAINGKEGEDLLQDFVPHGLVDGRPTLTRRPTASSQQEEGATMRWR